VIDKAQEIFDTWILPASPSLGSSVTQNTDYRTAPRSTTELSYADLMDRFKEKRLGPKNALAAANRAAEEAKANT